MSRHVPSKPTKGIYDFTIGELDTWGRDKSNWDKIPVTTSAEFMPSVLYILLRHAVQVENIDTGMDTNTFHRIIELFVPLSIKDYAPYKDGKVRWYNNCNMAIFKLTKLGYLKSGEYGRISFTPEGFVHYGNLMKLHGQISRPLTGDDLTTVQ